MGHDQVLVTVGAVSIEIDTMLAPLMEEMWKAFIMTLSSCQEWEDGDEMAWIAFPNWYEFKKFLDIVGDNSDIDKPDSLYRRINPSYNYDQEIPKWEFAVDISDHNICSKDGDCDFKTMFHLWFPQNDIPLLVDILKMHNTLPLEEG